MRLINFRIPAAIVGIVPATIVGFALIASAKIEPVMAAVPAMELFKNSPGNINPINGEQEKLASFNKGGRQKMSDRDTNQASFITIVRGTWRFCDLPGYAGLCRNLGPGEHDLNKFEGGVLNDKISSFKRLR